MKESMVESSWGELAGSGWGGPGWEGLGGSPFKNLKPLVESIIASDFGNAGSELGGLRGSEWGASSWGELAGSVWGGPGWG